MIRPDGVALSVEAFQSSHVSPSPKTFALRLGGVEGGVVSPVDDSRIVTARLSDPENDPPLKPTDTDAAAFALPVWNVPPDAATERTTVRVCRSQIGVDDAEPLTVPCVTVTDDDWPVAPAGQATATAMLTSPPDVPMSWPWSAIRATTPGTSLIVLEAWVVNSWPFFVTRTKAVAVQLPSVNRLPLTALERATCGVPVQVAVNVPEPPRSFWRTYSQPAENVEPTSQVTVTSTFAYT